MIINQKLGEGWASYHGDCVFVMRDLPDSSIDFNIHSPPFLSLYIYSDSVADLGNTDSEEQFFEGYYFALQEMYRTLKPGSHMAIHCKDTMRYMSTHGYAGLYDFPSEIIQWCLRAGFLFQRWITIWKDPVIEMQRTKTYGLLHKSFQVRAEVTRQGCADYVLVFQKPLYDDNTMLLIDENMPDLPESIIARISHQWSQANENIVINQLLPETHLSIWNKPLQIYTDEFITDLRECTVPGRLATIRCKNLVTTTTKGEVCRVDMMGEIIRRFQATGTWKFHSRCALTDGTYLVTFRNWQEEFKNEIVKHYLKSPLNSHHQDYIGNNPPVAWGDESYYSILVWQKYASPVWFDLDGLPSNHPDCWMTIDQTNVLNHGLKSEEEQRHICPLQLDLISKLIGEYTNQGDVVYSPYSGIGSEMYQALKLDRKTIGSELKDSYWRIGCNYLKTMEREKSQLRLF